jgi:Arc/MetJ family transcription regulator
MRVHIELDDELLAEVDKIAGARGRSAFVRAAIETAVRQANRWAALEAAAGSISDHGHEWDEDPGAWVRQQRHADVRRAG